MPLMEHPDLPGQPYDSPDSAVPEHRASGWRLVGEEVAEPGDSVPPADPSASGEDDKQAQEASKKSPRGRRTTEGTDV